MQYTLLQLLLMLAMLSSGAAIDESEIEYIGMPFGAPISVQGSEAVVEEPLTPDQIWLLETIEEMTLPEKIGQMIISGIDGQSLSDDELLMIRSGQVGGVIFLGHNVKGSEQFEKLIDGFPDNLDIPLFMSIDQEGGRVQRLPLNRSDFPSALSIGKAPDDAYEYGVMIGQAVKDFDLNLNLAPVLDVFSNSENKVIGNRSFGRTPETVAYVGVDVMLGMQDSGTISCVKHFPGHGDTLVDSHEGLPVVDHDLDRLMSFEWIPFKRAIEYGTDMIMTAHVLIPSIDKEDPATLSKAIISEHLRGGLGFDGVVITDDLVMGAISKKYPYEVAVRKAVDAGVDIMLISNNNYVDEIQHALYSAVRNGELDEERIDISVERILKLKYKYLIKNSVD